MRLTIDACIRFRLLVVALACGLMAAAVTRVAAMPTGGLGTLSSALTGAAVLAALALLSLLLQLRLSFAALFGGAMSLAAATAVLALLGHPLNAVVTLGLLLALAIVVAEAAGEAQGIATRLGTRRPGQGAAQTVRLVAAACGDLRGTLWGAGLAAVVCVVPLLLATGPAASALRPAAVAFALAVAVSMLVAVTVTPALTAVLLTVVPPQVHGTPLPRQLARGYARSVAALDRRPRLAAVGGAASAAVGVAGLALLPRLHTGLLRGAAAHGTPPVVFAGYVVIALGAILLITLAATGTWPLTALAFGSLPVSVAGGVFTVFGLGVAGQLAAAVGLLAVLALAVRQAIAVTVRTAPRAGDADEALDVSAAPGVPDASGVPGVPGAFGVDAASCFAEIVTPAAVTALVVVPFLVIGGLPGMGALHTAAAVILGGLGTTTLVSLFVLPVACPRVARASGPWRAAPRPAG